MHQEEEEDSLKIGWSEQARKWEKRTCKKSAIFFFQANNSNFGFFETTFSNVNNFDKLVIFDENFTMALNVFCTYQCDQTTRLFAQNLATCNKEKLPNGDKNYQRWFDILPTAN